MWVGWMDFLSHGLLKHEDMNQIGSKIDFKTPYRGETGSPHPKCHNFQIALYGLKNRLPERLTVLR